MSSSSNGKQIKTILSIDPLLGDKKSRIASREEVKEAVLSGVMGTLLPSLVPIMENGNLVVTASTPFQGYAADWFDTTKGPALAVAQFGQLSRSRHFAGVTAGATFDTLYRLFSKSDILVMKSDSLLLQNRDAEDVRQVGQMWTAYQYNEFSASQFRYIVESECSGIRELRDPDGEVSQDCAIRFLASVCVSRYKGKQLLASEMVWVPITERDLKRIDTFVEKKLEKTPAIFQKGKNPRQQLNWGCEKAPLLDSIKLMAKVKAKRVAPYVYDWDPRIGWQNLPDCPLFDRNDRDCRRPRISQAEYYWGGGNVGWHKTS